MADEELLLNLLNQARHDLAARCDEPHTYEECPITEGKFFEEVPESVLDYVASEYARGANDIKRIIREDQSHTVDFIDDGFGLMHPISCRPSLLACETNIALAALPAKPVEVNGRYKVSMVDGLLFIGEKVDDAYDPILALLED